MDLVGACRAFVKVSERGSFTVGAAAARMAQSVASRRIAALEKHLGEPLLERTARRATLTPFGRDLLPHARRLVQLADLLEHEAETAKRRPFRLAVPDSCPPGALARLIAAARRHELILEPRPLPPAERAERVRVQEVRAALVAVPADEAVWTVPLGLAQTAEPSGARIHLETLRAGRTDREPPRRVWLQPEDEVPHVRDPLGRLRDAVGLRPAQVRSASSLAAATAEVLGSRDLLLCSAAQAGELGLFWRPLGETALVRGYDVAATVRADGDRIRTLLGDDIAHCLGADTAREARG
ncbi:LysR family transcriptional regulator [Streptomyces harbinensis]|uniref:LysR family transcriptional regulator n=1 Tax=Streptomyces harbinensis TaxID=1176198 RepID=UPI0037153638